MILVDVEQVAKVQVDSGSKLPAEATQSHDDALRHFGDKEQYDNCQQHPCGAVRRTLTPDTLRRGAALH